MKKTTLLFAAALLLLGGCQHKNPHNKLDSNENGIYYWKTHFNLDEDETYFLAHHQIKTMYVRFFDVDINDNNLYRDKCAPVATIQFYDDIPFRSHNVVPVIFITPEAIAEYETFTDNLAHRLFAMCDGHLIKIKEVQFDCDWTESTHDAYFQFLKEVRVALKRYFGREIAISSTIRLHQLSQTPPEVDYGVLMCYNTGDFKNIKTNNSILDVKDVEPYVKHLHHYALPLKLALPDYDWYVEFDKDRQFVRLNKDRYDPLDTLRMKQVEEGMYEVVNAGQETVHYVKYEAVPTKTILETKALVEKHYGKLPVILFHFDLEQLSKYSDDEIKSFFN